MNSTIVNCIQRTTHKTLNELLKKNINIKSIKRLRKLISYELKNILTLHLNIIVLILHFSSIGTHTVLKKAGRHLTFKMDDRLEAERKNQARSRFRITLQKYSRYLRPKCLLQSKLSSHDFPHVKTSYNICPVLFAIQLLISHVKGASK